MVILVYVLPDVLMTLIAFSSSRVQVTRDHAGPPFRDLRKWKKLIKADKCLPDHLIRESLTCWALASVLGF